MKPHSISGAALVLFAAMTHAAAADAFKLDREGYVRNWVILAPVPLPQGESGAEGIHREQLKGEAMLRPTAGEKVKVGAKELAWQNVTAQSNYFDFSAVVKSFNDREAGYAVTYIECETEKPDVIMAVGSNDEGRIYFNGTDIYIFSEPRTLTLDADKGKVTLKKGINVIVFKVINEQGNWQGAMRLLDKSGAPLKDVKVKLSP